MNSMLSHRSIRKYKSNDVSDEVIKKVLEAGIRASNTGNMQVYSVIITKNKDIINELSPLHFNQPMVKQAPLHFTFCVDINRFSKWCKLRNAKPGYDNFLWFLNGTIDAVLVSQNMALAAEEQNLGICYLGTCLYNAKEIIEILKLPKGVFPIASYVMGYPDENPELTPRLPLDAVIHFEKYEDYNDTQLDNYYEETESSELTKKLIKENQKENLAQIFTDNRYKESDNLFFSKKLQETLKQQGFL